MCTCIGSSGIPSLIQKYTDAANQKQLDICCYVKLTLKIPADSAILPVYIEENLWGKGDVSAFYP